MKTRPSKLKILEIDPWLQPFKNDLSVRMKEYEKNKKKLLKSHDNFKNFANGHLYFGFHEVENGWIYREWAPNAHNLSLIGDFNDWNPDSHPLSKKENGVWEIFIPGKDSLYHGCRVKVKVNSMGKTLHRIPLYIKRTIQDTISHDFSGQIWKESDGFIWSDQDFKVKNEPLLIYETHIGMAQEKENYGTFKEFEKNILPRIKDAGYNTVQLMAIMQHPYYGSFGYHVSNFFAVSSWFGNPTELKELVNTAHSMGLNIIMDIVHSHAVKNIAEGIDEFDGTTTQFFHEGLKGIHPAWDSKLFDYSKPEVIHFLLSNIKFWMDEYHFDGFRFDGVTSMIYDHHGLGVNFDNYEKYFNDTVDMDAINYLQYANELIKEIRKDAISISEDMSGMPGMALPIEYGGIGFDYRLSMGVPDFWIRLLDKKDENWSMYDIWYELTSLRPKEKRITYVESHDQALVGDKTLFFRLADQEIYWHMEKSDKNPIIDRAMALHKMIRFITITLSGEGYLNFMGNEFGHPEWIDFPREGNNWSFKYCKRQWSLGDNLDLKYNYLKKFDKDMIDFTKINHVLETSEVKDLWLDDTKKIIIYKKNDLIFLFNFHPTDSFEDFRFPTHEASDYKVVFDSDAEIYGGHERISRKVIYSPKQLHEFNKSTGISIYSPSRTFLVLKKID